MVHDVVEVVTLKGQSIEIKPIQSFLQKVHGTEKVANIKHVKL